MALQLTSPAFETGGTIPKKFTCDGPDVSPALKWSDPPSGTQSFAVIMDDPDAPRAEPWVHWVLYKVPAGTTALAEGIPTSEKLSEPDGALQGKNSWGTIGYRGPAPPPGHGVHHYHFKLYALDAALALKPGADKKALLDAMAGHILAQGEVIGTYQR